MRIFNQNLYSGNILSFVSEPMKLDNIFGYCIQIILTGNPAGTIELEGCNDSVQNASSPTNWNNIADSLQTVPSSGTITYNVSKAFYNYVRVVYTDTSGGTAVGTGNITGNCKGL